MYELKILQHSYKGFLSLDIFSDKFIAAFLNVFLFDLRF